MWQCFAVLAAFGATFRLDEAGKSFDYAITFAILLCTWLIATNLDASAWFNRNIAIITNIERLFLNRDDVQLVHPFFGKRHDHMRIITHFQIQIYFAIGIAFASVSMHFLSRVRDGFEAPMVNLEFSRSMPYIVLSLSCLVLWFMLRGQQKKQLAINSESPGAELTRITCGNRVPTIEGP